MLKGFLVWHDTRRKHNNNYKIQWRNVWWSLRMRSCSMLDGSILERWDRMTRSRRLERPKRLLRYKELTEAKTNWEIYSKARQFLPVMSHAVRNIAIRILKIVNTLLKKLKEAWTWIRYCFETISSDLNNLRVNIS